MSIYNVNSNTVWQPHEWYEVGAGEAIQEANEVRAFVSLDVVTIFPLYEYAKFEFDKDRGIRHGLGILAVHQHPGSNRDGYFVLSHLREVDGVIGESMPIDIDVDTTKGTRLYTPNRGLAHVLLNRVGICSYREKTE